MEWISVYFHDDQQIYITVLRGGAMGIRTKQDDPLRMEALRDLVDEFLNVL